MLYLNKRQTKALYRVLNGVNANTMNKRQRRQFKSLKRVVRVNLYQQKIRKNQMSIQEINRIWDY